MEALFIGIDISEKKRMEMALAKEQEERVKDAQLASLGEMAASIAHEIKSPLSVIFGNADLIQINAHKPDLVLKYVGKVAKTADRINKIIKALQNYSRRGEHDPFANASLREIVEDTIELCQEKFRRSNVAFLMSEIPGSFVFECRATQISQVLLNLLKNAVDAVEKLETRWVRLGFLDQGHSFVITITDSGRGIPPEIRKKLMQKFFTTKEAGKGTGIGLSLSRRIAEEHKGTLEIAADCKNTCFILTLPKKHSSQKTNPALKKAA